MSVTFVQESEEWEVCYGKLMPCYTFLGASGKKHRVICTFEKLDMTDKNGLMVSDIWQLAEKMEREAQEAILALEYARMC